MLRMSGRIASGAYCNHKGEDPFDRLRPSALTFTRRVVTTRSLAVNDDA
jgi:hypothetical protein